MRLESLSLRGISDAFPDQVTLAIRDLPSGLIVITGENGAGKSTLMESPLAALYRRFPSRDLEPFDYTARTDAFIETEFVLEGRGAYRARLNLDGPHRKAEAALLRLDAGGDVFLSDGKVSSYDAAIARLLPPLDDLLASVFAAQNRAGSFSALDRKGRRELFASLLGLERYAILAERARQASARITREIETLIARRDVLARAAGSAIESALEQRAQQLQVDGGSIDVQRVEVQAKIRQAETALAALREAADAHAAAAAQVARLTAERLATQEQQASRTAALARLASDRQAEVLRLDAAFAAAQRRGEEAIADTSGLDVDLKGIEARLMTVIADTEQRIGANQGLITDKAKITAADARVTAIAAALATNRAAQQQAQATVTTQTARDAVQRRAMADIEKRETQLERARNDAARIGEQLFGDACAPCHFLTSATAAKANIPGLEEAVASKPTVEQELATIAAALTAARQTLTTLGDEHDRLTSEAAGLKTWADKVVHLGVAEERIAGYKAQQQAATAAAERERLDAQARQHDRLTRLAVEQTQRQDEYRDAVAALETRTAERRAELETLVALGTYSIADIAEDLTKATCREQETAEAARQAAGQQTLLDGYRVESEEVARKKARIEGDFAALARDRQTFATAKADYDATHAAVERWQDERVEWDLIAKACGPEGLPTLEIDAAGPTVSAFANDLAQGCAFPFTFEVVTQAPKVAKGKDGSTHREVLEVNVYSQKAAGAARDIANLSGGERVLAEEILRSAIALLVNSKNVMPIRTLWRDESTGALDTENAPKYMTMLRRVLEIGGFVQCFVITHSQDCANMADAQIRVGGGRVAVVLPPYETDMLTVEAA